MAVYRQTPTCQFCGEVTHEAVYKDQRHLPVTMQIIGDTFEGWNDLNHTCRDSEDFKKQVQGIWEEVRSLNRKRDNGTLE